MYLVLERGILLSSPMTMLGWIFDALLPFLESKFSSSYSKRFPMSCGITTPSALASYNSRIMALSWSWTLFLLRRIYMQIKMPSAEKSNTSPPIKSQTQLGTLLPESCSNQEGSAGLCSFLRKLLFSAKSVKKSSDLNCKYVSKLFFGTSVYKSI